ncbi:hypothetical protein [Actinomycetospora cinnamomea]|uniref:hypothetical protein n=1 Tax=Actinomycetospora cinnamomea TaxID=663609 RepID=UPI000E315A10|nr:hypothetical protein [Actinomycetospora cinnamomea]
MAAGPSPAPCDAAAASAEHAAARAPVSSAQPPVEVAATDGGHQQRVGGRLDGVAGLGELGGAGEGRLGGVVEAQVDAQQPEPPQHVEAGAVVGRGAQQPLGGARLAGGDAGGGVEQLGGVDGQALGDLPRQQAVAVLRPPGARGLQRGPQPPVRLALLQRRGAAAQELGVERVRQRHVEAPTVARRGDEALGLQGGQGAVGEGGGEDLGAQGLTEGERAHQVLLRR